MRKHVAACLQSSAVEHGGFKANAYRKAAAAVLAAAPFADEHGARRALKLTGRMMQHVIDTLSAGGAAESAAGRLAQVSCIGPVAAKRLAALGVTDVDDLRSRAADVGLTAAQTVSLTHHEDIQQRIPREEMLWHERVISAAGAKTACVVTVTGSFRRGEGSSGDIDVLLVGNLERFLQELREQSYIVGALAEGGHKFMGVARLHESATVRRLDVLSTKSDVMPFALLHFTGPAEYNVVLRKRAITKGWSLSERGLVGPGAPTSLCTERDVVEALGVEYDAPDARSGALRFIP